MKLTRISLVGLSLMIWAGLLTAEDKPAKTNVPAKEKAEADPQDNAEVETEKPKAKAKKDPLAIPEKADARDLVEFIEDLAKRDLEFESEKDRIEYVKKLADTIITASGRVLDDKTADNESALDALDWRFVALDIKQQLGQKDATKLILELCKKYESDSRKELAKLAQTKSLLTNLKDIGKLKEAERDKLLEKAFALVKGSGKVTKRSASLALAVTQTLQGTGENVLAAVALEKFGAMFGHTGDEELDEVAAEMLGTAKRLRLIGNPIEIEGTLLNGKPVDWASYKGKVVLIDFWATWCGPCRAELPNVKRNYAGYHAKGFEVLGVSLDDEMDTLKEFISDERMPWSNIVSTDEKATGFEMPLVRKYAISSIPFTVLVGKDGKVIKMDVYGDDLGAELEKLLGAPDAAAIKAAEEAEEKDAEEAAAGEKPEKEKE